MRSLFFFGLPFFFLLPVSLFGGEKNAPIKTGDWHQWRGPNRDGLSKETGLLSQWPKEGPTLLWNSKDVNKGKNVGIGLASIVISKGKIFTLGDRDKQEHVFCLDLETGKEIWATPFSPPYNDKGPRCTPTVDGNRVYGLSPQGILVCMDATGGSIIWEKDLKKDFGGKMMSGWNYSESPLIDGDKLICTPGGKDAALVALKKDTGDLIWKCAIPKDSGSGYASIMVGEVGGVRQYITLLGREMGLVGVNAKTGQFLWNYQRVGNGTANIPTPIVKDDMIFTSTGYHTGSALLQMIPKGQDAVEIKEIYFLKGNQLQNHHGGLLLIGDHIFGGHGHNDGEPFCLEMKTGKFSWEPRRGPGSGSAAVVYADGHLYFRYQNNVMALIEANPQAYVLKGEFQLPKGTSSPGWQHPVIYQGKLYIRGNDQILCYDVKKK